MTKVKAGQLWRHRSGNYYRVLAVANEYADDKTAYPVTVVYSSENCVIWSRPLSDWHQSMKLAMESL